MGVPLIAIRPMASSDLTEVVALETAEQPRPWSERMFRDELQARGRTYLVAMADTIVGFGGIMVIGDEAHVTNLLVTESLRGQGVGSRLVLALIESAVDQGARHLTLEVRTSNEVARGFYAGFGLAPVGIRPKYYGDEDALIMWAHDIATAYGGDREFASGGRRQEPDEETVG